jgi:hypothetical protein
MELNLTYEESKRILELGYDFTSICRDFELREKEQITKFVLVDRADDGMVSLWDCSEHEAYAYSPKSWWIIPIIPEAALAKCLPEINEYGWYINVHNIKLIYEDGCTDNCQTGIFYLDDIILMEFDSAFEAFTWCHEKYPEELKAKFTKELKV